MPVLGPVVEDDHLGGTAEEVQLDLVVAPVIACLLAKLAQPHLVLSKLGRPTSFQPETFQGLR